MIDEPIGYEHHEYRPYGAPGEIRIHAVLASQYVMFDGSIAGDFKWLIEQYKADKNTIKIIPLYAAPQRPWVGLTEEKIKEIWLKGKDHGDDWADVLALAKAFEAELKRLNT